MTWAWKTVGERKGMGSYAHWFDTMERDFLPEGLGLDGKGAFDVFLGRSTHPEPSKEISEAMYNGGEVVPLPSDVTGGSLEDQVWTTKDVVDNLPTVPDDTVITGIIDVGISLAHMRTRFDTQETRFVAIWQQGAKAAKEKPKKSDEKSKLIQPWLPSGREIYAEEINCALRAHSNATGTVDEDAFNRALGISDPLKPIGNRELETAAAHGTHVLDLAAGHDPSLKKETDLRERHRIIAVNLPAQFAHGSAGNFLPYFAVYGLERLLFLADALWVKNKGPAERDTPFGYPIVVNFSYGMRAGPKDGYHIFEQALKKILKDRNDRIICKGATPSPVRVIMPAGNENLDRGAASSVLGEKGVVEPISKHKARESIELPWRMVPDDSTPNFVELWTQARSKSGFHRLLDPKSGLHIWVTPPGHEPLRLDKIDQHGKYQDLTDEDKVIARVYVSHIAYNDPDRSMGSNTIGFDGEVKSDASVSSDKKKCDAPASKEPQKKEVKPTYRLALLICVPPTLRNAPPRIIDGKLTEKAVAPAGAWTIRVDYDGKPVDVTFYIQSDQSAVRGSKMGKKSYFDHSAYRPYLSENERDRRMETGEIADTYSYDRIGTRTIDNDHWEKFGPVQRRGSHNALSSIYLWDMTAVGSFDDSDGIPSIYSSTTDGNPQRRKKWPYNNKNQGRDALTVVYPGENAPSLFGLLGAGTRDGSVVPYRGTSMSTALAARDAALAFLTGDPGTEAWYKIGREKWFRRRAKWNERAKKRAFKKDPSGKTQMWDVRRRNLQEFKVGRGRVSDPRDDEDARVPRLGPFD